MVELNKPNKWCPECGEQSLRFIEVCESDNDTIKTSWTCDCGDMVVYIYHFEEVL